jgi:hypothetical protein
MRQKTLHERTQDAVARAPEMAAAPLVWRWWPRGPQEWISTLLFPGKLLIVATYVAPFFALEVYWQSSAPSWLGCANLIYFLIFFLTALGLRTTGRPDWKAAGFGWSIASFLSGALVPLIVPRG